MKIEEICQNCKFFEDWDLYCGLCLHPKIGQALPIMPSDGIGLQHRREVYINLFVGKQFGCKHWTTIKK